MYSYHIDTQKAFELVAVCGTTEYHLLNATLTTSCCGGHISIGNVCPACLTATLEGKAALLDADIALIARFAAGDIALGNFRVAECQQYDYNSAITAYDSLYWATGGQYVPTVSGTPKAGDVLTDIARQLNLEIEGGSLRGTGPAVSGQLTGYSTRDMLGFMAALMGRNVVITRLGKLKLVWFSSGMSVSNYYADGLNVAGAYYLAHITVKVPTGTDQEDTITLDAGSGTGMGFEIENPFFTQTALDSVWASIGGLSGHLGTLSAPFGIEAESGDIIGATAVDGSTSNFLATSVVLSLDGGCKCDVTAAGQSATQSGAVFQGSLGKSLTRLQADVAEFAGLKADVAEVKQLKADVADIKQLKADVAEFKEITVKDAHGQTRINGGDIMTGTIEAESLKSGLLRGMSIVGNETFIATKAVFTDDDYDYSLEDGGGLLVVKENEVSLCNGNGDSQVVLSVSPYSVNINQFYNYGEPDHPLDVRINGRSIMPLLNTPKIQAGSATITPSAANTPTYIDVRFPEPFSYIPIVTATAASTVVGTYVTGVGVSNVTSSGFRLYVTRTNKTATVVNWIAVY